jgi:hypothetical protein
MEFFSVKQAASILGIDENTVRAMKISRLIPVFQAGPRQKILIPVWVVYQLKERIEGGFYYV